MATKDYSSVQENMIADYLGWSVVSGSGAAACYPGDVISDDWLGECKTHVTRGQNIFFSKSVWKKICDEAMVKRRYPVLFTDDGSQQISRTWCMISLNQIHGKSCRHIHPISLQKSGKAASISFKHSDMYEVFEKESKDFPDTYTVFIGGWPEYDVVIVPLEVFKHLIEE